MQAEEDYEALVVRAKGGDADAIEEWLSSLARRGLWRRSARVAAVRRGGRGGGAISGVPGRARVRRGGVTRALLPPGRPRGSVRSNGE